MTLDTPQRAIGVTQLPAPAGPVTVFYPAEATAPEARPGPAPIGAMTDAVSNAAPAPGNRRLIAISHGSGGSPSNFADLTRVFVAHGFTVALPEHAGDNWHSLRAAGPASWKRRPREVTQAIDAVAADARLAPLLDCQRVGVFGLSAGGLTALTLAGARWSPAQWARHCDAHIAEDFPGCVGLITELTGGWLDPLRIGIARRMIRWKFGGDAAWQSWTDPRIRAAVAAVPLVTPIDMASLARPEIPLGLVRAGRDAWLTPRWHADALRAACKSCVLVADMPQGGHGSLISPQPEGLSARAKRLLGDPPGFDRASLPAVYEAIARFFIENLA